MRYVLSILLFLSIAVAGATAGPERTTLGDIPRTYSHYMNAREAALCRASAATGGLSAYFFNPACAADVSGVGGQATLRFNSKSREYLPDGDESLTADDDFVLFSQAMAVKRTDTWALGFGYSCPSYRDVDLTGRLAHDEEIKPYTGHFNGSLRFFEAIFAARFGSHDQGVFGISTGAVNVTESAKEIRPGEPIDSADLSGLGYSLALGFSFDATEALTFGLGYRWGSEITMKGQWYRQDRRGEKTVTQPVAVGGVRFRPVEAVTLHASYIREGWDKARADLSAQVPTDEDPEYDGSRDEFDEPISSAALGAEVGLMDGQLAVRAGYSQQVGADIDEGIVPDTSIGFGGSYYFVEYFVDVALVREGFKEGGRDGGMTNVGLYLTIGYLF